MTPVPLLLLALLAAQASTQLIDFGSLRQPATCFPACGAGECCTTVEMAVVSRKRAAGIGSDLLIDSGLVRHMCQPLKQRGETCLRHNIRNEWCNCTAGLTCAFSETASLNNFFGVCQ